MNKAGLLRALAGINPPYTFYTEASPGLSVDLSNGKRISFTSGFYTTDDPTVAADLLAAPNVTPGSWAKALEAPEPEPEPAKKKGR